VETCLECARGFVVQAKLLAIEEKEVYALESKLQILDSKILALCKALKDAKKYRLAFQKLSTTGGSRSDLIISNPTPTTHPTTRTTKVSILIVNLDPCSICKFFYATMNLWWCLVIVCTTYGALQSMCTCLLVA
jgi:hypothetical protein